MANYDWPFGTLPFGLFGSNLDTRDLETYPRGRGRMSGRARGGRGQGGDFKFVFYSVNKFKFLVIFENISLFGDSRAI